MHKYLVLLACIGFTAAVHVVAPGVTTQYHAQDELGQYAYGYSGGPSAKEEVRTADGITRGAYSYIDGHGLVQSAAYVSDSANGFRVAATNLPVGPAVPASPAVVAAAPAVAAVAPAVAAVTPAVAAVAPAAAAPVVVEARARLAGLFGLHHLKKRAVAAVVQPYTNYPGSTAPLVHAPVVHTPLISAYAAHPWTGLVHVLKKRDLIAVGPLEHPYDAVRRVAQAVQVHNEGVRNTLGVIPLGSPADNLDVAITKQAHLHQLAVEGARNTYGVHLLKKRDLIALGHYDPINAARTAAHLVQLHNEGVRNTLGVVPLGSPADSLDVAITKQAHLHQVAAEGLRNTLGYHVLKKRALVALGLYDPYNAARSVAQAVQVHNEGVRNTLGVIPLGSPADTPDVAITKQAHLHQVAAEGVRNTLGLHVLKKRALVALGLYDPYNAARSVAQAVQVHNEGVRNTAGIIPLGSPADTPEVAITKQAHLHQVAIEGARNTLGAYPLIHRLKRSPSPQLIVPAVVPAVRGFAYHTTTYANPLLTHTLVHV
ncbi:hypothetical protein O3M35_012207 [Rhynocoris fuscipes]|uniref:Cuticle protein 6 n=1 Tax=Rhynocoris fuscipes TaxID=488301 RepID=A0AAW1CY19_9HEMI